MRKEEGLNRETKGMDAVVLYRLPNHKIKHLVAGKAEVLPDGVQNKHLTKKGFVFEPFIREKHQGVYVNEQYSIQFNELAEEDKRLVTSLMKTERQFEGDLNDFESYKQQFESMHAALKAENLEKVILSRSEKGPAITVQQVLQVFDALANKYAHAFVYAIYTPSSGLWIGAGPEPLLKYDGLRMKTVALAGTLPTESQVQWQDKEKREQQLVTEYVSDVLHKHKVKELTYTGPETILAGQVKHLCSRFEFQLDSNFHVPLLYDLHPTPAVCGRPKREAMDLIKKVEQYDRAFYAGFIGPVNEDSYEFYVNIRCMQVFKDTVLLYLGGGLTTGSQLQKEWDETTLKAQTLLSVLKNIQPLHQYE